MSWFRIKFAVEVDSLFS